MPLSINIFKSYSFYKLPSISFIFACLWPIVNLIFST
nr:MAG TPA: hypothetical protein [Caudoviricetes sp.]